MQGPLQKKKANQSSKQKDEEMHEPIDQSAQVDAFIWDRDSHGLYDYESNSIVKQTLKCTGCNMIARRDYQIKATFPNVDNSEEFQNLVSLVYKQGQYWMFHAKSLNDDSFKNHADRVWRIVKWENYQHKRVNTFRIVEGDVVKFGRVRFKVKKLVIDKNDIDSMLIADEQADMTTLPQKQMMMNGITEPSLTQNNLRVMTTLENDGGIQNLNGDGRTITEPCETRMTMNFNKETAGFDNNKLQFEDGMLKQKQQEQDIRLKSSFLNRQNTNRSADQQQICRICLSEEEDNNPLISPCSCTGSMKNIHIECLKEWLEGKKHMKETPAVNSYIWKNLECEICKSPYTDVAKLKNGKLISLLNYTIHEDALSYMIIESVTNTTSKTIHIINFNQRRKIKVGRGQNAEVRITDISVSRFHTLIKLSKMGEVIIEDNQSKFGTLVQLSEPIAIKPQTPLYVQVGRSVLAVYSVNRFTCIQRCLCGVSQKKKSENCLHYDEVEQLFPYEFAKFFERYARKFTRQISKPDIIQPTEQNLYLTNNENYYQSNNQQERFQQFLLSPTTPSNIFINGNNRLQVAQQQEERLASLGIDFVTMPDNRIDSGRGGNDNQSIMAGRGQSAVRIEGENQNQNNSNNLLEVVENSPIRRMVFIQNRPSGLSEEWKQQDYDDDLRLRVVEEVRNEQHERHPLSLINSMDAGESQMSVKPNQEIRIKKHLSKNDQYQPSQFHNRHQSNRRSSLFALSQNNEQEVDEYVRQQVIMQTYENEEEEIKVCQNGGDEPPEIVLSSNGENSLYNNILNGSKTLKDHPAIITNNQRLQQQTSLFTQGQITNTNEQNLQTNFNMSLVNNSNNESDNNNMRKKDQQTPQIKNQRAQHPNPSQFEQQ